MSLLADNMNMVGILHSVSWIVVGDVFCLGMANHTAGSVSIWTGSDYIGTVIKHYEGDMVHIWTHFYVVEGLAGF